MFKFMRRNRKQKKGEAISEKRLNELLEQELSDYVKQEDLEGYLDRINRDKEKKEAWGSLPIRKKIKLLKYIAKKERGVNDKRRLPQAK